MNGRIFNIQHFSVHDGPGIRTVVFLKGCPLRCRWCGNPESQSRLLQTAWSAEKCIGCQNCINQCNGEVWFKDDGTLSFKNAVLKREEANRICPSGALHVIGEDISTDKVLEDVKKDMVFYRNSHGGLTVSGGEPLMQPEFTCELLQKAHKEGIHCAIETTGYADWNILKETAKYLDYIIYDLKSLDDQKHQEYTGGSNVRIIENFKKLCESFPDIPLRVRTPIIPEFNDTMEDVLQILDFLEDYPRVEYELLQYHKFGISKYKSLDEVYKMPDKEIEDQFMKQLNRVVKERRCYDE